MPVVTDYTALISGYSWNGMTNPGAPIFVSYSFLNNNEVPSLADYQPYTNNGYYEFTATQRASFRSALDQFELIAGVKFIEVDNPALASIDIMNTSGSQWGGWANYGIATDWYTTDGYIVIDGTGTYAPGTGWYEVLLHEVGHAMGLKHPFSNNITLDPSLDNENHTLMSYTSNGVYDTSLAHLDVDALQYLYSDQTAINPNWSWNWSDITEQFTLSGAASQDILIGIDAASTISGLGGNDTLWGRDAADTLIGGVGNDTLNGGSGIDTAVFSGIWSDYIITETVSGVFSINDSRGVGYDGLDTVTNIEFYQFADGTLAKNNLLTGGSNLPDLIVGNVSITGSSFSLGQIINVNFDVTNLGTNLAGSSDVAIYLSQSNTFDQNTATLVAITNVPAIFGGDTLSSSHFFVAPSGISGPYNVFVVADENNVVVETNEINNVSSNSAAITITGPDLTSTIANVANTTLLAGQSTTVSFNLENIGDETASLIAINTGIYLSSDNIITAADTLLVDYDHTLSLDLAPFSVNLFGITQTITLDANLAPGTYYIGTIADSLDNLAEGNEGNNASSAPIQITVEAAAADLTVSNLAMANTSLTAGDSTTISSSLNNIGNIAITGNFNYGIYLSTDAVITTGDTLLQFYTNAFDIAAGSSITNLAAPDGFTISASLAPGTYYIGLIADYDNAIVEGDETNNASPSPVLITVAAAEVDLRVHATHNIDNTTLTTGQTANYTYNITNDGNFASGAFNVGFYLSADVSITAADTLIGTEAIGSLAALTSLGAHTTQITIPASLGGGTYYIGIIADYDNQVAEVDEANNASPSTTGVLVQAPTDLSPNGVTVTSATHQPGGSFNVTFDVANLSVENSGVYTVDVYLSTDPTVTTADIKLEGTFVYSSLAGGASNQNVVVSVAVPLNSTLSIADGNYYVGVIVDPDNTIIETNETNNVAVAANTVTIHNPTTDLVASDFKQVGASATVPTGGDVSFSFDVQNAGDLDSGTFDARIYMSTDSLITTSDILLTTITGLSVTAGTTLNDQIANFNIPSIYNLGNYHFGVIADYNNQLNESNETNNANGAAIAITAAAPGNDPGVTSQWYINNPSGYDLNVQNVWPDYTGNGVKLAIIDTGIDYNHTDLALNYDTNLDYDFGNNDNDAIFEGNEAHGTQVAGVAGGASNGLGIIGVAPDLTLFSYRYGAVTIAQAVAQWTSALNLATTNADIVNMSLGFQNVGFSFSTGYYLTGAMQDNFLDAAYTAFGAAFENTATNGRGGLGTIITVSAGNERDANGDVNFDNMLNSPYTIAVGAVTSTGAQSSFSNGGAALLVSAPGSSIYTSDPTGSAGDSSGDYTTTSGTSFSSPAVAGVIALMLEANGTLGARDVQEILAYSALGSNFASNGAGNWNGGGIYTSLSQGFGRVDAKAAVRLAETWQDQHSFSNVTELTYVSGVVNLAIPDNGASITDIITVSYPSHFELDHVEVFIDLTHTAIDDLTIKIISADGLNSYLLNTPPTGLYQDFPTNGFTFMTTQFWGEDISGDWTISIQDSTSGDIGTLQNWSLIFYGDVDDGNDTYIYNDEYSDYAQTGTRATLTDSDGGIDSINAAQVTTASVIDLRAGNISTIDGESLTIAAGTTIENAYGGDGNDTLNGNAGDNTLYGGRGNDQLFGNGGNDVLGLGVHNSGDLDVLDGGSGVDTADFSAYGQAIWVDLGYAGIEAWNRDFSATLADLNGIENITGTAFNDRLIGDTGDNILSYTGGFDTFIGSAGSDTANFSAYGQAIWVSLGYAGIEAWNRDFSATLADLNGIENITGTAFNDRLIGDTGDNILSYTGGFDTFYGSTGSDTADFTAYGQAIWVDLGYAGFEAWNRDFSSILVDLNGIENITGTAFNDRLIGDTGDNILSYTGGFDTFLGSTGSDTADFSAYGQAIWVDLGYAGFEAWNRDFSSILVDFDSIENITGTSFDDRLIGNAGDNILGYTGGFDSFLGSTGSDTADFSAHGQAVWVNLGYAGFEAWNRDFSGILVDFDSIENIIGTKFDDRLIGDSAINILAGGLGADTLSGGDESDSFIFGNLFGTDTITDWDDTGSGFEDLIDFSTNDSVNAWADISGNIDYSSGSAVITVGGDTITLTNVTSNLDAGDFIF